MKQTWYLFSTKVAVAVHKNVPLKQTQAFPIIAWLRYIPDNAGKFERFVVFLLCFRYYVLWYAPEESRLLSINLLTASDEHTRFVLLKRYTAWTNTEYLSHIFIERIKYALFKLSEVFFSWIIVFLKFNIAQPNDKLYRFRVPWTFRVFASKIIYNFRVVLYDIVSYELKGLSLFKKDTMTRIWKRQ